MHSNKQAWSQIEFLSDIYRPYVLICLNFRMDIFYAYGFVHYSVLRFFAGSHYLNSFLLFSVYS